MNIFLITGGILSLIASGLHISVIVGGGDMYRTFGAGEVLAAMDESGSWYPALLTFSIASVLWVWAMYAFSGAGLLRKLPFLKTILVIITVVYLLRGLGLLPLWLIYPESVDDFIVWSSLVCMVYGLFYALGTWQLWGKFSDE